jgi:hypothetical protein
MAAALVPVSTEARNMPKSPAKKSQRGEILADG